MKRFLSIFSIALTCVGFFVFASSVEADFPLINDEGLIDYYSFEGNSNDLKGLLNGSDTGITYSSFEGKFEQYMRSAGAVGDGVNLGNDSSLDFTSGDFSFNFWINPTPYVDNLTIFARGLWQTDGYYCALKYISGAYDIEFVTNQGAPSPASQFTTGNSHFYAGEWTMVSVTRTGSAVKIYYNGVESGYSNQPAVVNPTSGSRNFYISRYFDTGYENNSKFDDFAIFNRVLISADIESLYNNTFPTPTPTPTPEPPGNRYWVGGTGSWSDATNHWAIISGGTPDASYLPTPEDDVFIDSNSGLDSGEEIITLDVNADCHDFSSTSGVTYSLTGGNALGIYGSAIFEAGITQNESLQINFFSTSLDETITSNGANLFRVVFPGSGGWTLLDDFIVNSNPASSDCYISFQKGTFDANDFNVTSAALKFFANIVNAPTVYMGSGTWTATGNATAFIEGVWYVEEDGAPTVIDAETSTIKLTHTEGSKTFAGSGKTYNNLWIIGVAESSSLIRGSNTFNDLKVTNPPTALTFIEFETTTVNTFTVSGTADNLITINSDSNSDQFILSKSSGTVSSDYLDISNSKATGGATWYAGAHSIDGGNNTGWIFENAPVPTPTQTSGSSVAGAVSDGLGCGNHDCNTTTSTTTRRSVSTVNPVSNPSTTPTATGFQLFDIALTIENAVLGASSELIARTQFTSFGTVPTLVNMVYRIEDAGGLEVFSENNEVTVETEQLVTKEFKNLEMKDGKYTLILSTTYGDNVTDEFRQAFEVKGISSNAIRIISIPIIAGLVVFGGFLYIKRKQKMSN